MKKKIITLFLIVTIVALATLSLTGCNGTLAVNPVDNAELVTQIRTVIWNEGATIYHDYSESYSFIKTEELTSGTPKGRYTEILIVPAKNKFDGYEFFMVKLDIEADRDVDVTIGVYCGGGLEQNLRNRVALSLKAGEKVSQEWDLTTNFIIAKGANSGILIKFEGCPASGTEAFKAWSQTQYTISNLEFYAVEPG